MADPTPTAPASSAATPVAFSSGPAAQLPTPGNLLDTSLQAGSGSTDLIAGAYYYQAISQNFDAFVNGQYQAAVMHKLDQTGADFRPGNVATVSFGLRYEADPTIVPQVQVNISRKSHDQGALADTAGTAGTVAYLSPGVTRERHQEHADLRFRANPGLQQARWLPTLPALDGLGWGELCLLS